MAHKSLTVDKAHAQRGCGIKVIKKLSTDAAQGVVFRAHDGAQQRLCGQVKKDSEERCLRASILVL
jgi:hypothetical protein